MASHDSTQPARDGLAFEDLIRRLRDGDATAADEVWRRFVNPLLTVAYRHLDDAIRPKLDADDIVQSAYRTFFMRLGRGQFELANWSSLWGLLVRITERKCARKAEFYYAQQRDVRQELALAAGKAVSGTPYPVAAAPAPDEQSLISEVVATLVSELTKPYERQVVCRLLEGWSVPDISADVGRSEYTVRRVAQRVRYRLEEMRDEE